MFKRLAMACEALHIWPPPALPFMPAGLCLLTGCARLPPVPLGRYISNLFLPSDLTVPFAGLPLPSHVLEASSLSLLKVAQLCPTLCDPVDCSPPGSSSHGILQARILECGESFPPPGDFPSPGTEPRSPALQGILYQWSPQGSPGILEWAASPFSRGSSRPRNRYCQVSHPAPPHPIRHECVIKCF